MDTNKKELLKKFVENTANDSEVNEVFKFLGTEEGLAYYKNLLDEDEGLQSNVTPEGKKAYDKVFSKISRKINHSTLTNLEVKKNTQWSIGYKVAASLLILVVAYFAFQSKFWETKTVWLEKVVEKGQKATIRLTDGTVVYLNSNSKLTYPEKFDDEKREVRLSGEGFFEVVHNPKKPFQIEAGGLNTTVLGTTFNIMAYPSEKTSVAVATGKVKVTKDTTEENKDNQFLESVILSANERVVYHAGRLEVTKEVSENIWAWKDGKLIFDNITLEEAAEEIAQWYGVKVTIENESIKGCRFKNEYERENLINVLEGIKFILKIDYRIVGKEEIILFGNECSTFN